MGSSYRTSEGVLTMDLAPVGLTAQSDFPMLDLTDTNAAIVELMLANELFVRQGHEWADAMMSFYRWAHAAILDSVGTCYGPRQIEAVNRGISAFEAIRMLVQAGNWEQLLVIDSGRYGAARAVVQPDGMRNRVDEVDQRFRTTMTNTAEVVRLSSGRFLGPHVDYAVLGAAVVWTAEMAYVSPV